MNSKIKQVSATTKPQAPASTFPLFGLTTSKLGPCVIIACPLRDHLNTNINTVHYALPDQNDPKLMHVVFFSCEPLPLKRRTTHHSSWVQTPCENAVITTQ